MTTFALATGLIWLALFGYVALLGRRLSRLGAELADLRRRLRDRS